MPIPFLKNVRRIAAFAPNWLGDAAMCTPALRALRHRFPEAELDVIGRRSVCELLEGLSFLDRCAVLPARLGAVGFRGLRKRLGLQRPDLAVLFPHSLRAALMARALGARRVAGYARGQRSALLTDCVFPHLEHGRVTPIYMGHEYLNLVRALGGEDDGAGLELHADAEAVAWVRAKWNGGGPFVGIAPGAAFGPSKRWMPEGFASVADQLAARAQARCVLLTGPGEEETRDAVLRAAKSPLIVPDRAPKSGIALLKAIVSQLDLLVCNDSGTRHIAVAFGVPTVTVMGSTSPRYSDGPYEKGAVLRIAVDCGPCQKPICTTDHRCMTGISPDWVVDTALEFISAPSRSAL